jgi:hypothetical protein
MTCQCAEAHYRSTRTGALLPMPAVHDCGYIRDRNALIPLAADHANALHPKPHERKLIRGWGIAWSACFLGAMQELLRESVKHN